MLARGGGSMRPLLAGWKKRESSARPKVRPWLGFQEFKTRPHRSLHLQTWKPGRVTCFPLALAVWKNSFPLSIEGLVLPSNQGKAACFQGKSTPTAAGSRRGLAHRGRERERQRYRKLFHSDLQELRCTVMRRAACTPCPLTVLKKRQREG